MKITVDLHSHSGYAGGVGDISFEKIYKTMDKKGIDIFGTGDCLHPEQFKKIKDKLKENREGIYFLSGNEKGFILQTEVILTTKLQDYPKKIVAHHIILFPDIPSLEKMQKLLKKWNMKNTIGRPYITTNNQQQLESRLFEIKDIDPLVEIIPAHIMTPDGILGSKNNLSSMQDFYGRFLTCINAIETGLSADPAMLTPIPDLADLTMISNSDCHSAALNRVGREFTILETSGFTYKSIINSIRKNQIIMTAEFHPTEGRYYLTGHRKNRKNHNNKSVVLENYPENLVCPICKKKMLLGVKHRCEQLYNNGIEERKQNFIHVVPLVEVIANAVGIKSVKSKKVLSLFDKIVGVYGSEIAMWQDNADSIESELSPFLPEGLIKTIIAIKADDFRFEPAGFDGVYGNLTIKSRS